MINNYEQAKNVCITILANTNEAINPGLIKDTIAKVNGLFSISTDQQSTLFNELETLYAVFSGEYRILDDEKPEPWIKSAKANVKWDFWNRYKILLENRRYAPDTINKLDNLTDDILDRLNKPGENNKSFDKRGLIVGHVQSGKTGNYIGLICKAADVGYKMIIVLSGIHNSLRTQTQLRIDEGFLGFDTQQARNFARASNRIGVGKYNPNLAAHSLTTSEPNGDFNRKSSESSGISIRGNDPIILVIKKNVSVMKNLLSWLASRGDTMIDGKKQIKDLPLLVIDDEADNASINISKNQVSSINACIRSLLKLFDQTAYIGYTATPYANIFIKRNDEVDEKGLDYNFNNISLALGKDIFPKNFIVNIPAPSNYIGPAKIFGIVSGEEIDNDIEPIPLFRTIDDYQPIKPFDRCKEEKYKKELDSIRLNNQCFIPDSHKQNDMRPTELPNSLKYAIKCFFLSCAARRVRGQEKQHNSMLIHVSRFIVWQDRIADLVLNEVKYYARLIEFNDTDFIKELAQIWNDEYIPVTEEIIGNKAINDPGIKLISWNELLVQLYPATAKIEVRAIHGDTKIERLEHKNIKPLDYYDNHDSGLSVIAIGGNKLSRGLTLEGLTISYFLRSSKMYDTLMQMGRWFGYRSGYLDLCRLFTSEELVEWYKHITIATEEMRAEFNRMGDLGKTPAEYGLKVRTHPGVLTITASNKFRYKKIMYLSFSGELEETYSFRKNSAFHIDNYNRTLKLINDLGSPHKGVNSHKYFSSHYTWSNKDNSDMIVNYLLAYKTDQPSFNVILITDYIQKQVRSGKLKNWTVALINNTDDVPGVSINHEVSVGLTKRTDKGDSHYYSVAKSHIIDPRHEYIDLTDSQIEKAYDETKDDFQKNGRDISKLKYPNTMRIKKNRSEENVLLLIYILKSDPNNVSINDSPITGLAISFPYLENDEKVEYAVNERFLEELDYPDELDEIEEDILTDINENEEAIQAINRELESGINYNKNLYLELKDGQKISYSNTINYDKKTCFAIPDNLKTEKSIPLIREEDISKYSFPAYHDFWVENSPLEDNELKDSIIAPKIYKKTSFAFAIDHNYIDESCICIQSKEIPTKYLLAVFNSVVFNFWTIFNDYINNNLKYFILEFPIRVSEENINGIILLVDCVNFLQSKKSSREIQIMIAHFINVIDVAILEIYFPEDFKSNSLSVLPTLNMFPVFEMNEVDIKYFYQRLNDPKNPVKKAIHVVNSIEKFSLIYNNLKY